MEDYSYKRRHHSLLDCILDSTLQKRGSLAGLKNCCLCLVESSLGKRRTFQAWNLLVFDFWRAGVVKASSGLFLFHSLISCQMYAISDLQLLKISLPSVLSVSPRSRARHQKAMQSRGFRVERSAERRWEERKLNEFENLGHKMRKVKKKGFEKENPEVETLIICFALVNGGSEGT